MKNKILRGEYRECRVPYYPPGRKPINPDYLQIKERGMRGEIGW